MYDSLDQFYTKRDIAYQCWSHLKDILIRLNIREDRMFFFEPSAGTGAFFSLLPKERRYGIDLEPKCDNIKKQNFFDLIELPYPREETIIIGNPPFGKRGKLAIGFFNHAAYFADIVAFIVPLNFRKFSVHKNLDTSMRFISKILLPKNAFELDNGKEFCVNTEFQIWTRITSSHQDMREYRSLPINHQDFQLWQYNNTEASLKVFDNPFDFAVPCQGWQDYTRKETDKEQCERNKQWMLFKANNPLTLKRLMKIDFERLASECATAVPGFRKADLVKEYSDKYE